MEEPGDSSPPKEVLILPLTTIDLDRWMGRIEMESLFSRAIKGSDYLSKWASNQWYLDPSPWYKYMRQTSPILYDSGAQTVHLFRYADCDRVLTQFRTFSNKFAEGNEGGEADDIIPMRSLLGTDPPVPY